MAHLSNIHCCIIITVLIRWFIWYYIRTVSIYVVLQSIPLVLNRNEGIDVAVPCHDSRPISTAVLHTEFTLDMGIDNGYYTHSHNDNYFDSK